MVRIASVNSYCPFHGWSLTTKWTASSGLLGRSQPRISPLRLGRSGLHLTRRSARHMDSCTTLAETHVAVLEAMTLPDPQPPEMLDSPSAAVHRRLPELPPQRAAEILHDLNLLGLTAVPYIKGMVSPTGTADLEKWITPEGRDVLRRTRH